MRAVEEEESEESEMSIRSSQMPATDDGGRLRAVKGTVLLHISYAAKQDQVNRFLAIFFTMACAEILVFLQELGREILKFLKSEEELSPFATAVALSVVRGKVAWPIQRCLTKSTCTGTHPSF